MAAFRMSVLPRLCRTFLLTSSVGRGRYFLSDFSGRSAASFFLARLKGISLLISSLDLVRPSRCSRPPIFPPFAFPPEFQGAPALHLYCSFTPSLVLPGEMIFPAIPGPLYPSLTLESKWRSGLPPSVWVIFSL